MTYIGGSAVVFKKTNLVRKVYTRIEIIFKFLNIVTFF